MKKVLICAYYWPPAGGPGVQRWLKFATYLRDYGIEPVVYVPENAAYPLMDANLLSEVPEDITVVKKPILEPAHILSRFAPRQARTMSSGIIPKPEKQSLLAKLLLYIRGNMFIPDARVLWVKPSVRFLRKYMKAHDITTVITTGPPHSVHLIGYELQKQGLSWIADFRDPWTTIGYHKELKLSAPSARKHIQMEKSVLRSADHIIVTSRTTGVEFKRLTDKPITVITNGYDYRPAVLPQRDEKFTVSHIGSLLSQRNPQILWEVLSDMVDEVPMFADCFELHLAGAVSQEVVDAISSHKLDAYCRLHGYLPHDKALELQLKSQVLLLIEINAPETRCIIPGKLFEYLVSGRPILAIGPEGSDFGPIVEETATGVFVNYSEKQKIRDVLAKWFHAYLHHELSVTPQHADKYSRKHLTGELAAVIRNVWES